MDLEAATGKTDFQRVLKMKGNLGDPRHSDVLVVRFVFHGLRIGLKEP